MLKRILIIDDDEDILEILHLIFQDEGYLVTMSNTGQAPEYIHQVSPNLIVLDICLKGSEKNGAEICRDFKSSYPEDRIPVILVSAEDNISLIASYCGADAYVRKPFDLFELLKRVEDLMP